MMIRPTYKWDTLCSIRLVFCLFAACLEYLYQQQALVLDPIRVLDPPQTPPYATQ